MWSICKKEIAQFFGNISGYIAILIFLLLCGLYLFVLNDSSIFENGYASLDSFFAIAPWFFLFLIPALCMRVFPEEYRLGTIEILKTRPVSSTNIVLGKYAAILVVILVALLPTVIYIFSIQDMSAAGIDSGGTAGSYLGLFLLAAVFAAISLCCGSFTSNSIIAFLFSALLCLIIYFGFHAISLLPALKSGADFYVEQIGIDFHYQSISRGVVDSRDIIYFLSIIFLALYLCVLRLRNATGIVGK